MPLLLHSRLPGSCKFPCSPEVFCDRPDHTIQCIRSYGVHGRFDRHCNASQCYDAGLNPRTLLVSLRDCFRSNHYAASERKIWSSSCLPCVFPNLQLVHLGCLIFAFVCSFGCMPLFCRLLWRPKLGVSNIIDLLKSEGKAHYTWQIDRRNFR